MSKRSKIRSGQRAVTKGDGAVKVIEGGRDKRAPQGERFTVIRSRRRIRRLITLGTAAALAVAVLIFHFCSPTGIIEYVQNSYALSRNSGDNAMTDTNATVVQFESIGNAACLLSDSYFEIFNSKGNNILYFKHGFASPVMRLSEARMLVYDRGGKKYKLFNCSTVLYEGTAAGNIITAAIGRNGRYAIASSSEGYASQLNVYDTGNEVVYSYKSVSGLISAVCFNSSCKRAAVSEIYTQGGVLSSSVTLLNIGSESTELTLTFDDEVITSLFNLSDKLIAASESRVYIINWKSGEYITLDTDGIISFLDADINGRLMLVYSRADKQTYNNVAVYSCEGERLASAEINAVLADIKTDKNGILAVYDNKLCRYDSEGRLLEAVSDGSNIQRIAFVNGGSTVIGCGTAEVYVFER